MNFISQPSRLSGEVQIPGSKSHTIRAVVIAGLAGGESVIEAPLISADALSAASCMGKLGAVIRQEPGVWHVIGTNGKPTPSTDTLDTGNSGTTMNLLLGVTALIPNIEVTLTGDRQTQSRPCAPLVEALTHLGARIEHHHHNDCPPFRVFGGLRGGKCFLEAKSSQYLSSLLLACPLAPQDSHIKVTLLKEKPYVQLTLDWLASQGIKLEHSADLHEFHIPGRQSYHAFKRRIPADFSSASFFLAAGALGDNEVTSCGLDLSDSQGDKAVIDYLKAMGADIRVKGDCITVRGCGLKGVEIDMDATPDALPVMAVMGCFAEGTTVLRNVAHARIKETDRIKVMALELTKLGAQIEELPDGLVIHHSPLHAATVNGHHDHRVVMSLALAGMMLPEPTTITTAEATSITFPEFASLMRRLGGRLDECE